MRVLIRFNAESNFFKSFADVNQTEDGGVNTFEFLEAADGVVGIFGQHCVSNTLLWIADIVLSRSSRFHSSSPWGE